MRPNVRFHLSLCNEKPAQPVWSSARLCSYKLWGPNRQEAHEERSLKRHGPCLFLPLLKLLLWCGITFKWSGLPVFSVQLFLFILSARTLNCHSDSEIAPDSVRVGGTCGPPWTWAFLNAMIVTKVTHNLQELLLVTWYPQALDHSFLTHWPACHSCT